MQAAAFWRGDIIKQETMQDFLISNQANSAFRKLTRSDQRNFTVHDNNLNSNNDWANAFDEEMIINSNNYHTNYFKTLKVLQSLQDIFSGEDLEALNSIITIFETVKSTGGREDVRQEVTVDSKRRYLSATEEMKWLELQVNEFKELAQKTSQRPSGVYVYGKNIKKYLENLMGANVILEKIYKNSFREVENRETGEMEIKRGKLHPGLLQEDLIRAKNIQNTLKEEISIHDISSGQTEKISLTVWDAISTIGEKYEMFAISDTKNIKENLAGFGKLTRDDRSTIQWLEENYKEYISMDLFHYYDEYQFVVQEVIDINNTLLRLEVAIKSINSEQTRMESEGKQLFPAQENKRSKLITERNELMKKLPELRQETIDIEQDITNGFSSEILEGFKNKIAGEYNRTAQEVADELLDEPSFVNIIEE